MAEALRRDGKKVHAKWLISCVLLWGRNVHVDGRDVMQRSSVNIDCGSWSPTDNFTR